MPTALLDDARAAAAALRAGTVSAVELASEALRRAEALDSTLGAFALLTPELALRQARRADLELARGHDRGPLHGVPLAVKDVIDVAGVPTRLGTHGAGHHVPGQHADCVDAVVRAGAVVIGKTSTHELALGMVTPAARSPIDPQRITGGSSGGSAAAVAAGICSVALGTDTNGSVRCPAALCGVTGLRPTFDAIARRGAATLAWSQDTVGVMASSIADGALLYTAMTAPAGRKRPARPSLRVGLDRALCREAAEPAVAEAVLQAADELAGAGVEVIEVSLSEFRPAVAASFVIVLAEAAAAWTRRGEPPAQLGPATRAALRAGAEVPSAAYLHATRVRTAMRRRLRALFALAALDAVIQPAVPVVAAEAGATTTELHGRRQPLDALHPRFAALASLTGSPALSVPCGVDPRGLPVGLELLGAPFGEAALLRLGSLVEETSGGRRVAAERSRAVRTLLDGPPGAARSEPRG